MRNTVMIPALLALSVWLVRARRQANAQGQQGRDQYCIAHDI